MTYRFFLLLPIFYILLACGAGTSSSSADSSNEATETVFYFTRHAEKGPGNNPGLLAEGEARATRLATMLSGKNVAAVYATKFRRTKQTAGPIAAANGLSVQKYAAGGNPKNLTRKWLQKHRGKTVVVVGHSNTIPDLVNALIGEQRYGEINESNYNKLFRVVVNSEGKGRVNEMVSSQ